MYRFEVTSADDFLPCQVIYLKKPGANCYIMNHWHAGIEINYMVSGCMDIVINCEHTILRNNEYKIINSHDIHTTSCPDGNELIKYLVLIFSKKYMKAYFEDYVNYEFSVDSNSQAKKEILSCLRKIVNIIEAQPDFLDLSVSVLTARILELLYSNCKKPRSKDSFNEKTAENNYARMAKEYVRDNYRQKITLNDVAQHVGLTPTYFSRYFKTYIGQTFRDYLSYTRLKYALNDIQQNKVSETRAALDNGFSSVKAFIATFKMHYGCTLSEYKKHNGIIPTIADQLMRTSESNTYETEL